MTFPPEKLKPKTNFFCDFDYKTFSIRRGFELEIDRYGFFEADTDTSKIFKSCIVLHYQTYDVFCALPFFQNLENQDL